MRKFAKNLVKAVSFAVTFASVSVATSLVAWADTDVKSLISDVAKEPSDGGVFKNVTDTASSVSQSGHKLGLTIGAGVALIMAIIAGISFMVNGGNGAKKEENKERIKGLAIGACFVFGAVSFVTLLATIGQNLFGSVG